MNDYDDELLDAAATDDMTVASLIGDEILRLPPTATVREAAARLADGEVGLLVLGQPGQVEGVISERDIVRAVAAGVDLDEAAASEHGSSNLRWTTPSTSVADVVDEMMSGYVRHVLVAGDDGDVAGIVSMRDVLAAFPR